MGFVDTLKHRWNAYFNKDPTSTYRHDDYSYYYRPDRPRFTRGRERSIITAVFNRIALDVAEIELRHVRLDDTGKYIEDLHTGLNECLTVEANIDQSARALKQDIVMSMFDEGVVAIVPIETTLDPKLSNSYDVLQLRAGRIISWHPQEVTVELYNEATGNKENVRLPKKMVAIVENPLYAVVNEPNSTVQRLIRKLNILDAIDEQTGSGKLDLIIQLPYTVKTKLRQDQAKERRADLEKQLSSSKYGVAYIDSTERVTQLNRPIENNLLKQIEYLTNLAYSQLGITTSVMDGSADEKTMLNYTSRTVEPIISAIVDEMKRKFITKTARTQGQSIFMYKNPFKLVPVAQLAEIADKLTRNEIVSSNEIRQIIGFKPSNDPKADELRNKNLNPTEEVLTEEVPPDEPSQEDYENEELYTEDGSEYQPW